MLVENDFRNLFESAPGSYLVLDPSFKIVAVTDCYLQHTFTKRPEITGRGIFEIFPDNPKDPHATGEANLRASLERVLLTKAPDIMAIQKYDVRSPEKNDFEEKYWSPINYPVFMGGPEVSYIIHSVEDVTEFVRIRKDAIEKNRFAEEMAETPTDKLRQAQRMEAMGQLAGGVAHDFNNILSVILMNCEIALESKELPESVEESFRQVKKASERAASLTRQLLTFSRKQIIKTEILNLNAIISDMEKMLRRLMNSDIAFEINLEKDLGSILADRAQVEQIILNLLINARDAIARGGKISIQTSTVVLDKALAGGNPKAEPGRFAMLAVRDTGIGMDAKVQARLFEPFFTTKGVGKGTGLGLATVYGIVSQAKGTIWVYSEPGKGSAFKIYFPLIETNCSASIIPEPEVKSLRGTEAILVVEDQDDLRKLICRTLSAQGYRIHEASNGVMALAVIDENPKLFSLIITDVVMPEMGGKALAEKVASRNPNIKVLYLSGYAEDTLVNYGVSGESPNFVEKPFTLNSLLKKVASMLN